MATRRFITSVLLLGCVLSWSTQSEAVPPGFFNFLASVDELLHDSERLVNMNSLAVVESIYIHTYIHTYTLFMLEIYRVAVELISSRK